MGGAWHDEARAMRAAGVKLKEIAAKFGVSIPAVSNVCRKVSCPVEERSTRTRKKPPYEPPRKKHPHEMTLPELEAQLRNVRAATGHQRALPQDIEYWQGYISLRRDGFVVTDGHTVRLISEVAA